MNQVRKEFHELRAKYLLGAFVFATIRGALNVRYNYDHRHEPEPDNPKNGMSINPIHILWPMDITLLAPLDWEGES